MAHIVKGQVNGGVKMKYTVHVTAKITIEVPKNEAKELAANLVSDLKCDTEASDGVVGVEVQHTLVKG